MAFKVKLTSFENASLLRKLSILYFLMSILPVSMLYFLYLQIRDHGRVILTEEKFSFILTLVVLGVAVGYFAMRSIIVKIMDITKENRNALQEILGSRKIKNLSKETQNEISILTQSFSEITSRLEENVRNLELAKKTLHSVLARVGEGISSMDNIDNFLSLILETVSDALQSKSGTLLLIDQNRKDLCLKTVFGTKVENNGQFRMAVNDGLFQTVFETKQPVIFEKIPRDGSLATIFQAPMLVAPLMLHDEPLGVITVSGRKSEEPFDEEEKNLLYNLALQTAVAIENSKLSEDAEKTYFETIAALALAVEAKDPYSRGHSERVAKFCVQIATDLKLSQEEIHTLRDAARLHDIGKIGVTDKVLRKAGPLTTSEMDMMKKHCEIGEGIIKPIRSLRNLCDLVRHHHEKLDGSGYPDGLGAADLQDLVRILTVADIYDALTSNRSYRKPYSKDKAIEVLKSMKDKIDQRFVEALAKVIL